MIYSSTIGGSYSLYYFDGNGSFEIPEVNSDRNELGADFFSYTEYDILGDVNADGEFSVADVVMMQKWLICAGDLTDWKAGDLYSDNIINVFDLCLMRRKLLTDNFTNM